MTLLGWITLVVFSLLTFYFIFQLVRDIVWNHQLKAFQKGVGERMVRRAPIFWFKRTYGAVIAGLFVFATLFTNTFDLPAVFNERVLVNAKAVGSESKIKSLIRSQNQHYQGSFSAINDFLFDKSIEAVNQPNAAIEERDFIGTNNQIKNVEEADIIKTDGHMIYYATRYQNHIRIVRIGEKGVVIIEDDLSLGQVYTDSIFLTDDYLIVIGYIYDSSPYFYNTGLDTVIWRTTSYRGTVVVYDRDTLEIAYKLETDSNFYQYRLIDQALFLISSKSIYDQDLRPIFNETKGSNEPIVSYLDYDKVFYFEKTPIYSMTVFTGIDLKTFNLTSHAFLGYVNQIHANEEHLYTTFSYTSRFTFTDTFTTYQQKTQILKFKINREDATLTYLAQGIVNGSIDDQYWMDEYENHLRVVTTSFNPVQNRLYVLKEKEGTDDLVIVGSITEGLGKPNERVYSVDMDKHIAYVVTFEQIDPRYRIDLSNPANPIIVGAEERPGFSTYAHIWDHPDRTVNFGFTADDNGRVTGMELTAFDDVLKREDSYKLPYRDSTNTWTYSYSEAAYNPKALMISPSHGIVAFPISSYSYQRTGYNNYQYTYVSQYLIFFIDFTAENDEDIISDPIIIEHPTSQYYFGIDRGIYISEPGEEGFENIYTFSNRGIVVYSLRTKEVVQTLTLTLPN